MQFALLSLLPALAMGIVDFGTCDGDGAARACMTTPECSPTYTGATCAADAAGAAPAPGAFGCCVGGTADATTTTTTTTVASAVTTTTAATTCVDKLNPLTGVSDCPARASLCNNSVYLDVMRDQCPKTCNLCSSTGTGSGTVTNSTSCVDLVNPTTRVSDCPTMRAYCTNTIYQPLMRIQCPATCGFCTSG